MFNKELLLTDTAKENKLIITRVVETSKPLSINLWNHGYSYTIPNASYTWEFPYSDFEYIEISLYPASFDEYEDFLVSNLVTFEPEGIEPFPDIKYYKVFDTTKDANIETFTASGWD